MLYILTVVGGHGHSHVNGQSHGQNDKIKEETKDDHHKRAIQESEREKRLIIKKRKRWKKLIRMAKLKVCKNMLLQYFQYDNYSTTKLEMLKGRLV